MMHRARCALVMVTGLHRGKNYMAWMSGMADMTSQIIILIPLFQWTSRSNTEHKAAVSIRQSKTPQAGAEKGRESSPAALSVTSFA